MAKLFVYDAFNNRFYTYNLNENDPMPYSYGSTLKLREFRGSSGANVLWTTTAAMEAWNLTRRTYGKSIPVGYAFKRIGEGGHGTTSQHYAGVAFDVGQSSGADARNLDHFPRCRFDAAGCDPRRGRAGTGRRVACLGPGIGQRRPGGIAGAAVAQPHRRREPGGKLCPRDRCI